MGLVPPRHHGDKVRLLVRQDITNDELKQLIEDGITITVIENDNRSVRFHFSAAMSVKILREELLSSTDDMTAG
ncbi:carbon storage regulator [Zestomonas carbonaria]|uniref:Carbon storage regulator, CsrA n=1 Tax=Zestomonas carbonaria TaxID=2762745 RepID=A0A7U7ESR9_9GAMM|nr:carbon storage regulator [Pseudomonas carbonaria]CAD5110400.1 hypothetical protein PSEWESI4_04723 [Pseudomonas carbonaria]